MITHYLPTLLTLFAGIKLTLTLMSVALIVGAALAILLVTCIANDIFVLKKSAQVCIFFITGTPLLVQIYLIYYGLGQFETLRTSAFWFILREPLTCAIIAFAMNTACYSAVLLQGALRSVPTNQVAAAYALGMNKWQIYRRILLPQAFRIMLPAYTNEVVILLKSTSLVSTIAMMDVMGVIQKLISLSYDTLYWYGVAACIYLILNAILLGLFNSFSSVGKKSCGLNN